MPSTSSINVWLIFSDGNVKDSLFFVAYDALNVSMDSSVTASYISRETTRNDNMAKTIVIFKYVFKFLNTFSQASLRQSDNGISVTPC
jgi:uncharacterized membrane protein